MLELLVLAALTFGVVAELAADFVPGELDFIVGTDSELMAAGPILRDLMLRG